MQSSSKAPRRGYALVVGAAQIGSKMTGNATHAEEMGRLVAELELLASAQASTVVALARAGHDTAEARRSLYDQVQWLSALHHHQAGLDRVADALAGIFTTSQGK